MDISKIDLWYRRLLVVITTIVGGLDFYFEGDFWINSVFIICMAGVVGYFTNFLAIKMLFQPKQGKVLGWEGLVPKNKSKIARSLGNSIQNNLLHPDIIMRYMHEKNLIEKGLAKLSKEIDEAINNDEVRGVLTDKIISMLKKRGPEIITKIFDFSEETLKKMAGSTEEVHNLWVFTRAKLVDYLNEKKNREEIAKQIRIILLEELPKIAELIDEGLEEYLEKNKSIGTTIGIGIKKLVSFDENAIHEIIEKFIQEKETSDQFMAMMDKIMDNTKQRLNSKDTQEFIVSKVKDWLDASSDYARINILPKGIERLEKYLDEEENWDKIDNYILRAIDWLKVRILEFIDTPEGQEYIRKNINKFVQQINVTQLVEDRVMKLDTDELETMILDNTGGNLVVIQFLGGILGMIAGFIQVNILFSIPVGALCLVAYISHRRNQKRYEHIIENEI